MNLGRFFARLVGGVFALGVGALILIPLTAMVAVLAMIVLGVAVFALKVLLFAMLLSWLFRKLFVGRRAPEPVLVGAPVADVAAPRRDKYDIAAERELDEELGL